MLVQQGSYPRKSMSKRTSLYSSSVQRSCKSGSSCPAGVRPQWVYSCGWGWNSFHGTHCFLQSVLLRRCIFDLQLESSSVTLLTYRWSWGWSILCPQRIITLRSRGQKQGKGWGEKHGALKSLASGMPEIHSLLNKAYSLEPLKLHSFSYHWTTNLSL